MKEIEEFATKYQGHVRLIYNSLIPYPEYAIKHNTHIYLYLKDDIIFYTAALIEFKCPFVIVAETNESIYYIASDGSGLKRYEFSCVGNNYISTINFYKNLITDTDPNIINQLKVILST